MSEQSSNAAPAEASAGSQDSESSEDPGSRQLPVVVDQPDRSGLGWWSRFLRLFKSSDGYSLREDLKDALSADGPLGAAFTPEERAMLHNILRLREVRVEDVMIPRAEIIAVECGITLDELMALFEESGHSRMPVYGDTLDDPRGMVHIRDLVAHLTIQARNKRRGPRNGSAKSANGNAQPKKEKPAKAAAFDLTRVDLSKTVDEAGIVRDVLFVPPSMLASDLMQRMQAMRTQMALVIDEYGGTDGLVSLEDIVEMVVGDIEDEHDDEADMITRVSEDVFVADARAELEDIVEVIGGDFNVGDKADDVDTLGGLIYSAIGRIPARGEVVRALPQFEFHVLDADPRRIRRVRIVRRRMFERRRRPVKADTGKSETATKGSGKQPEPAGQDTP
ncbi:hemolysin family protein [Hoeflea prorocentri]|uniref:Hemolysin family protein n=1 Tax=Hoeflea prorocentri TaxID=1922333 RepID=A0A9X3UP02_9HYPH|nr:hemolysin family protein [Hoeflea prorocentri]MCY6382759.1 hemolysin family protein [Hoeflea prorocentri]MDA5400559.1 hemolysin family protein [Hoeflea prorocentri]